MLPGGGDVDRIDSSAARVIASEPSSTAWTAAARTSRSRLPIIPLLRLCR